MVGEDLVAAFRDEQPPPAESYVAPSAAMQLSPDMVVTICGLGATRTGDFLRELGPNDDGSPLRCRWCKFVAAPKDLLCRGEAWRRERIGLLLLAWTGTRVLTFGAKWERANLREQRL